MSSLLGFLCVLSAFTATGYSLTCKQCLGQDPSSCVGTTETCPADHACGAVRSVTKIIKRENENLLMKDESEMDLYFISCVALKECNSPGSISAPGRKIRRGTSCCYTSNCVPPAPQLPADDKEANGLFCGTCLTETSTDCSPDGIMECTGKEDMCLFQTTLTTGLLNSQEALRGCSTKSYCNLAKQSVKSVQMNVELTYSCTPGGNLTAIAPTDQDNAGNSHSGHHPSATLISILLLFLLCGKW